MTKPGYTHIIVPQSLHDQLKNLAQQNNLSISQLITQLVNINVNVNVSINTGINTATLNKVELNPLQTPNTKNNEIQTQNIKTPFFGEAFCEERTSVATRIRDEQKGSLNPEIPARQASVIPFHHRPV